MISLHRAVKNIIAILTGDVFSKMLGMVSTVILARYLGPEAYGKYCFILSYAFIFTVIADFGLNDLIVRDVARDHSLAAKYFAASFMIKALFSIISILLFIFSVYFMGYPKEIIVYVAMFSLSILFITFGNSVSSIFKAFERMQYSSLMVILNSSFLLFFVATIVYFEGTLFQIILSRVIALCVGSVIGFFILMRKIAKPEFNVGFPYLKTIAKNAFPFLTVGLIHSLYFNLDVIMLSKMRGPIYVGWFTPAANDLFFSLLIIPTAIATVAYPIFSRQYHESTEKFRESFNFTVKVSIILGVAISAGVFMLAQEIIHFFFGSKYENSVIVLRIIALAISFIFVKEIVGFGLATVGQVNTLMWLTILSLGLNAILNLILIPIYAHIGAAITSVICIFSSLVLSFYYLNRKIQHLVVVRSYFKPLIGAMVMCSGIYFLKGLHLLILIAAGAVIYLFVILIIRTFNGSEKLLLRRSFKKGNLNIISSTQ